MDCLLERASLWRFPLAGKLEASHGWIRFGGANQSLQTSKDDHLLAKELFDDLPQLLEDKRLVPNRVIELEGLDSVLWVFEMYRKGEYSAQKLVCKS